MLPAIISYLARRGPQDLLAAAVIALSLGAFLVLGWTGATFIELRAGS